MHAVWVLREAKEGACLFNVGVHQYLFANQWYVLADFPASKLKYLFMSTNLNKILICNQVFYNF